MLLKLAISAPGGDSTLPTDWNPEAILWLSFDEASEKAPQTGKPICLIFYTDWCPHCHNYSRLFYDPALVKASKGFHMVRVNRDARRDLSEKFRVDGDYIPRTYFLKPDGTLLTDIHAPRKRYKYFYNEHKPADLIKKMLEVAKIIKVIEPLP